MRSLAVVAVLLTACRSFAYSTFDPATRPAPRSILEQRQALEAPISADRVESLDDQPAVRHRRLRSQAASWQDVVVVARRPGWFSAQAAATVPLATVVPSAVPDAHEQLVVEAWIEMTATDVGAAAAAVEAQVTAAGGRVVSSSVIGNGRAATSAALELRVPPARTSGFLSWLGSKGVIESRRTLGSDVGKLLLDQQLELDNLKLTMSRLQRLAEQEVPIAELLAIEREMTRVRGEIERIEGEQRWLVDRVELATVTLAITRDGGAVDPSPDARIDPGPHLAALVLLDPGTRARARVGGGATLHVRRHVTFELDVFPGGGGDSRAVIATVGTAMYSGRAGGGDRRALNPYLGVRAGYGYLSGERAPVVAAELGLELVRHRYLLVEVAARAVAFVRDDGADAALHALAGAAVPF